MARQPHIANPNLTRPTISGRLIFHGFFLFWMIFFPSNTSYPNPSIAKQTNKALGLFDSFTPNGDIRRFAGETLYFDLSFLWFENAATAKISFIEENGLYFCILEAQTKGFVGWFTAYRKHVYKAYFDVIDDGNRVRAYRFEWLIIAGDDVEKADHHMDYVTRKHSWVETKNGKTTQKKTDDIPEGVNYDDILSAFFNFRNSAYGKLEKGSTYTITTIPKKGHKTISVQIKNGREKEEARIEAGRKNLTELLMIVLIPKEIFKTKHGQLLFWASKNYIPLETTVKDYIFLGDLDAKFNKRVFNSKEAMKKAPLSKKK